MNVFQILFHLSQFAKLAGDVKHGVEDAIAHKLSKEDLIAVIDDLKKLIDLVDIPGVTPQDAEKIISELEASIQL